MAWLPPRAEMASMTAYTAVTSATRRPNESSRVLVDLFRIRQLDLGHH